MARSGRMVAASHETGRIYYHDGSIWHLADVTPGGKPRYTVAAGETFYVASQEGGLLKSTDGGIGWKQILDENTVVVAADASYIAAATTSRLMISDDGGTTWKDFPLPPQGQVRAMAVSGSRLHAGTAGGGMFWMPLDEAGLLPRQAGEAGPGILPVREDAEARAPEMIDGSFLSAETVNKRWSIWTGQGQSEKAWRKESADDQGGSLVLRSLAGEANTSAGLTFPAVENGFAIALAWKSSGTAETEFQVALRSYRGGTQTEWNTLSRTIGPSPEWTWINREVRLAEGADRGEVVVVLKGEGSVWLDALSTSVPPQIFGTPQE
jgi:hypothetical protein